jgi:teichuronic acid biosynthesis glycosyltransferase TuaC
MKKKILFISHMYPTSFDKSYGKVIHEQAISLIKKGYEIKVICPVPYTPPFFKFFKQKYYDLRHLSKMEVHDGIEVYYPRYMSLPKLLFFNQSGIFMYHGILNMVKRIKKKFDFDIIHAHFTMPDAYAAMKLSRYMNIPLITTLQATDLDITINIDNKCKSKVHEVFKYSSEVICPTPRLSKQLLDTFRMKSHVIGYGVDLNNILLDNSKCLSEKYSDQILIMSVCRLLKTKGLEFNIQAIKDLKRKYKNIKYLIIGDGPEKENLRNLVENLKLSDYVEFLGELDHRKTIEHIAMADIFALPSWQETFGLVYLEAMANEIPVIGCRGQGFDGIIEHQKNGYLAKPKDVESLSEIINTILTEHELSNKVRSEAKETVLNEFTFERISNKIDEIYKNI